MGALGVVLCLGILFCYMPGATADVPTPKTWPTRFHALLVQEFSGQLGVMDLWYDWAKGGNLHIIQNQLEGATYDMEWNNGTSFFYDLKTKTCSTESVGVGILRPDWLHDANYLGVQEVDGFTCNVWEKLDFITYYEDVETKRPVYWVFYTGRKVHIITFEEGVHLQEDVWQAPTYCFKDEKTSLADFPLLHGRSKGQGLSDSYKEWLLSGAMSA